MAALPWCVGWLGGERAMSVGYGPASGEDRGERLDVLGLHPRAAVAGITSGLSGEFDRIVSAVAVRPVPALWLTARACGGRRVTATAGDGPAERGHAVAVTVHRGAAFRWAHVAERLPRVLMSCPTPRRGW